MKKRIFIACLMLSIVGTAQAQTATEPTPTVECSSKTYFSDNQCEVCYEGGEITPDTNGVKLKEVILEWENDLDGINQNFYETSQNIAEIKTNIGTAPNPWDETGLEWGTDVKWTDNDGLNIFSLDAGKTVQIKTISGEVSIPLTSPKQPTSPHFVVKIPISYYELKMGTFKESEKKTKNYCVSYTPKKVAGTTTDNTTSTTTNSTTTTTPTTSTTTDKNTTSETTNNKTVIDVPEEEPKTNTNTTTTSNEEIPSYDAKVTLNSAGQDPLASEASRIATGPAENLLFIAALLVSALMFPKMNQIFNQE